MSNPPKLQQPVTPPRTNSGIPQELFYANLPKRPKRHPVSLPTPSTPVSNKASGKRMYASKIEPGVAAKMELAREMEGHFIGPVKINDFLDLHLSVAGKEIPSLPSLNRPFLTTNTKGDEYLKIINAITPFAPGLRIRDTHSHGDSKRDDLSPDISAYPHAEAPGPQDPVTDLSKASTFVELKPESQDPFQDPWLPKKEYDFTPDSEEKNNVRGQLGSYTAAIAGSQFRTHVFGVLICGYEARLMYWDRNGANVTEKMDIATVEGSLLLGDFFWRYSNLTDADRGYDTSVTTASDSELKKMDRDMKRTLESDNAHHREFRKILVPDRNDSEIEHPHVISYPPFFSARSPFGRATRPMKAYDMKTRSIVFLKDYWRAEVAGMQKEGEIYRKLEEANVPNIPPFGHGNDVRNHHAKMRGALWLEEFNLSLCHKKDMNRLNLYRMTLKVIGRRLTEFTSTREFVNAIADAMQAHDHAAFDARVLHRDVSVGNVIIDDNQIVSRGLLIDWDLSLDLDACTDTKRRDERTGTWQFISAAMLADPTKRHEIEDDRESALHLLTWLALRFTKHDKIKSLSHYLVSYDESEQDDGDTKGGTRKRGDFTGRVIAREVKFHVNLLNELIPELVEKFAARYDKGPTPQELDALQTIEAILTADPSNPAFCNVRASNQTYKHIQALEQIKKRGWLVDTLDKYLNRYGWPRDDKAVANPIHSQGTKRKRMADDKKLAARLPARAQQVPIPLRKKLHSTPLG